MPSSHPHGRALMVAASALIVGAAFAPVFAPQAAKAQVAVSFNAAVGVGFAPPPLPIYDQPPIPGPGWLWVPGNWAWNPVAWDYYWTPGYWAQPPAVGLLWTPGWWGWNDGLYAWNTGYWAPQVGYYGGIDYGFGYNGVGYFGGYWSGNSFFYNRAVNNVATLGTYRFLYSTPVAQVVRTRASFFGPGGTNLRADAQQAAVARLRHVQATALQQRQMRLAAADPRQRASVNHGAPAIAATQRPGAFKGAGVIRTARAGGAYQPPPEAGRGPKAGRSAEMARLKSAPAAGARMAQAPSRAAPPTRLAHATAAPARESRMAASRAEHTFARTAPARTPMALTPARTYARHEVAPQRSAAPRASEERRFAMHAAPRTFAPRMSPHVAMRAPPRADFAAHAAPRASFSAHAAAPHGVPAAAHVGAAPRGEGEQKRH